MAVQNPGDELIGRTKSLVDAIKTYGPWALVLIFFVTVYSTARR